jgi:hypothetical protein
MSVNKRIVVLFIILLLSLFSGCTLLNRTEFSLISLVIEDDDGFVGMSINFNTSDKTTLKLIGPDGDVLFLDDYYMGNHNAVAYLSEFRKTPHSGRYDLKAYDKNENLIFENELFFRGSNLSIVKAVENWWLEDSKYSLVGLSMTINNQGDLPAYPYIADIQVDNQELSGLILPTVILPSQSRNIHSFVYIDHILPKDNQFKISLKNYEENIIANISYSVFPTENTPELMYSWRYKGNNNLILPDIDFLYEYYKSLDRFNSEDYAAYVFDRHDNPYINLIAEKLLSLSEASTDVETINFVTYFIQQQLEYVEDDTECDYPRYPVELLKDSKGDCEDKAILTASILDRLGYNVSLLKLPNHVAVGVHLDESATVYDYYIKEFYYLETTSTGWTLGKVPPDYKGESNVTVYPISKRPLLIHSWKNATRFSSSDGADYVKMKILIENLGQDLADNFIIWGAFFHKDDIFYNQETISVSSLAAGMKNIVELTMDVPQVLSTKLKTQIYLNNEVIHERESSSSFP